MKDRRVPVGARMWSSSGVSITTWENLHGEPPGWIGVCKRCHAIVITDDIYRNATLVYNGRGDRHWELKPCPIIQRTSIGHGDVLEEECGGPLLELPMQTELLAAWMIGGAPALEPLISDLVVRQARPPQPG